MLAGGGCAEQFF